MQRDFVCRAFNLGQVTLRQLYVPSSEGQVRAALADWGVTVVPRPLVADALQAGQLRNVCPAHTFYVPLYWHCWNLASDVLNDLSTALRTAAAQVLEPMADA